jgi:hypothetical protein
MDDLYPLYRCTNDGLGCPSVGYALLCPDCDPEAREDMTAAERRERVRRHFARSLETLGPDHYL